MQTVWKGSVSFGLINVPVKMSTATKRENIAFKTLHRECNTPLQQKRYCPKCEREVAYEDVVKGYEYEPGRFVILSEEDLDAIQVKSSKYIDIVDFIRIEEVDPIFYDKTYYLAPEKGGEKPYLILRDAMRQTGRVAVAKVAIRQKEYLCLVRLVGDALALETMFFPEEVRPAGELGIQSAEGAVQIRPEEMQMAVQLVENLTAPFTPEKYKDDYREELLRVIRAKVEGREVVETEPVPERENVIDLMEKLRKSVAMTQGHIPGEIPPAPPQQPPAQYTH
jgi:DNA end-binding protein Ku